MVPKRALLLDALGTLVELEPPWRRLGSALGDEIPAERLEAAMRAEMSYYREHSHEGRDPASLGDLRARCAAVLSRELGREVPVETLMAAIRFHPYPDAAPALDAARARELSAVLDKSPGALVIEDDLAGWDGRSEQVPADGYAILFGRSIAAPLPDDLPTGLALAVMDVCGAPALTARHVGRYPDISPLRHAVKASELRRTNKLTRLNLRPGDQVVLFYHDPTRRPRASRVCQEKLPGAVRGFLTALPIPAQAEDAW